MIAGIGTDIVEVKRVAKAARGPGFMAKCFSQAERAELNMDLSTDAAARTLAGRWAAKEAVAKALGTGFANFGPADVEIFSEASGKPVVRLQGNARLLGEAMGAVVHVSISHCEAYAAATAIAENIED